MSRKNFVALAAAIKDLRDRHGDTIPAIAMVNAISGVCIDQCPNFNLRIFEAACEPSRFSQYPVGKAVQS